MASKHKAPVTSLPDFIHNKHIFFLGLALMVATIGLVVYDYSIGESIFDSHEAYVLGAQATLTPTPQSMQP